MPQTTAETPPAPTDTAPADTGPADTTATPSPYDRLGGAAAITAIVERFYDLMESEPAFAPLRAMHAPDLAPMRVSLAGFLTGWAGGPRDWFTANPGRCMMSMHKPFAITHDIAGQWAAAMRRAIEDAEAAGAIADPQISKALAGVLEEMALGMGR